MVKRLLCLGFSIYFLCVVPVYVAALPNEIAVLESDQSNGAAPEALEDERPAAPETPENGQAVAPEDAENGQSVATEAMEDGQRIDLEAVAHNLSADVQADSPFLPFPDVKPGTYYYDAVIWATGRTPPIISGYSDGLFHAEIQCTRMHIILFIWRACGCPTPNDSVRFPYEDDDLKDLPAEHERRQAALWAYQEGIESGDMQVNGKLYFNGGKLCSRGAAMTYLWKIKRQPIGYALNPFTDLDPQADYYLPVLWATSLNPPITTGKTPTTFKPEEICTRGHIAAFLYRYQQAVGF